MSLHAGRVFWVTGAASGIGRATALRLAGDGARVLATDIEADGLARVSAHPSIAAVACDVTREADNAAAVAAALDRFGVLHGAVLNAGIVRFRPLDHARGIDDLRRMLEVNVIAVVLGIRAALPALRSNGGGAISITASVSGLRGDPLLTGYNASKGAVANLVRALAQDLGGEGIRINAVAPGPTATGMTPALDADAPNETSEGMRARIPLGRWADADEQAAVHSFLLSADASFLNGAVVPVDGGVTSGTGQFAPAPHPDEETR